MAIAASDIKHENPAFYTADGIVSYGELEQLKRNWQVRLGDSKRLVFLQARNNVNAISLLLACLDAGHPVHLFDNIEKIESLLADYDPNLVVTWQDCEIKLDWRHKRTLALHPDLRVLLSTSGSTGTQKLVRLSQTNLSANADSICTYLGITSDDRAITGLNFSYSFGLSIITSHFRAGAALILTDASVLDDAFWASAANHGATSFSGVPYTFELLQKTDRLSGLTSLKTVTQAGGRLSQELVRHYGDLGQKQGWRFFVMYGQTEASPRIAYLPPDQMAGHEDCIGLPIPGVALSLIDRDGALISGEDGPGELVCTGANVMMGYARSLKDLALPAGPNRLETGDLAERLPNGLYRIVGRKSRFVKLFGLRVNLDQVERWAQEELPSARAVGNDETICIVIPDASAQAATGLAATIATRLSIPAGHIESRTGINIPTFASGKTNYTALMALCGLETPNCQKQACQTDRPFVLKATRVFLEKWRCTLGLGERAWTSVHEVYASHFDDQIQDSDTFQSLAGDSLSYVSVYLDLEAIIPSLPETWPEMTVRQLQDMIDVH